MDSFTIEPSESNSTSSFLIRKTVIRRGWKYLPMSIEMQTAQVIESANEQGQSVHIESSTIEGEVVVVSNADPVDPDTGEITMMAQADFDKKAAGWRKIIIEKKQTVTDLVAMIESKGAKLTDGQKITLDAFAHEND